MNLYIERQNNKQKLNFLVKLLSIRDKHDHKLLYRTERKDNQVNNGNTERKIKL